MSLKAGQLPDWDYKFHTIIDNFSGGVYDPYWGTYGAMILHGGGHASTYDNSVLILDFNDLTFKRLSNASPQSAFTDVNDDPLFNHLTGEFGDGQPGSGHSFDILAILPPSDGGAAAGSLLRVSGHGVHYRMSRSNNWAHRFDITPSMAQGTRGSWVHATDSAPTGYTAPGACSAYDATRKRVWWMSNLSSQPPLIRYLDVPARAQRTVFFADDTRVAPQSHSDAMAMRYHAPLDILILSCSTIDTTFAMAFLDCKNPEAGWSRVTVSAQVPTAFGNSHPFDYVPEIDRYVMLAPGDGSAVYEIQVPADPAAMWSVTRRTFTGLATIPRSYVTGKRWSYAPAVKAFVWQARHDTPLHVYRPFGT